MATVSKIAIIRKISLAAFVFVGSMLVGSQSVEAVCQGTVKCRPYNPTANSCASTGFDNTGCGEAKTANSCNVTYDWGKECRGGCYVADTCDWNYGSQPTPTPKPGDPTPEPDFGDRWRIRGRVEYYPDWNLRNASNIVTVSYNSGSPQKFSTDNNGIFSADRRMSAVSSPFSVRVEAQGFGRFKTKNNVSGCTRQTYAYVNCDRSRFDHNDPAPLQFNFVEEAPNQPPSCDIPQITSTSRNCGGDGRTVEVKWQNVGCSRYRIQYTDAVNWKFSTETNKTSLNIGNLDRNKKWSFRVACIAANANSCIPQGQEGAWRYGSSKNAQPCTDNSPNQNPSGWFIEDAKGDIPYNSAASFQAKCHDPEGKVTKARIMRSEKPLNGGSWSNWNETGNSERTNNNGTSPLHSGRITITCNQNWAKEKSHRLAVECEDVVSKKCSGNPNRGWQDCGNDDYYTINCRPQQSQACTPPTLNVSRTCNNGKKQITATVSGGSGSGQYKAYFGAAKVKSSAQTRTGSSPLKYEANNAAVDHWVTVERAGGSNICSATWKLAAKCNQNQAAPDIDRFEVVNSGGKDKTPTKITNLNLGGSATVNISNNPNINVRAIPDGTVGSIVFRSTRNANENFGPYYLYGDDQGDPNNWPNLNTGNKSIEAKACSGQNGAGSCGPWRSATLRLNRDPVSCTVNIREGNLNMGVGDTRTVNADVTGNVGTPTVTWSDLNNNEITILNNGNNISSKRVRADRAGNAKVRVTVNGNGATCTDEINVTVAEDAPVTCEGSRPANSSAHDAEEEQNVPDGTRWTYRANDNATKCQFRCNGGYEWRNNRCQAAQQATCSVDLDPGSLNLEVGDIQEMDAWVTGNVGNPTVTWSRSSNRVSVLNGNSITNKRIRADRAGNVDVTVEVSGNGLTCSDSARVTVGEPPATQCTIGFQPGRLNLDVGEIGEIRANISDAPAGATLAWRVPAQRGNATLVDFPNNSGTNPKRFVGVAAGSGRVEAAVVVNGRDECTREFNVTVSENVQTVSCNQSCDGNATICESGLSCISGRCRRAACSGQNNCNCPASAPSCRMRLDPSAWDPETGDVVDFTARVDRIQNGSLQQVSISANNNRVNGTGNCTSSPCTQRLTARQDGRVTVTASARIAGVNDVCTDSTVVNVVDGSVPPPPPPPPQCTVSFDKNRLNVNVGETDGLTASVDNAPNNATIRWQILNPQVVTFAGGSGVNRSFAGDAAGDSTIRAQIRVNGSVACSATVPVSVANTTNTVGCNRGCGGNNVCRNGLACVNGICKNPSCSSFSTCSCVSSCDIDFTGSNNLTVSPGESRNLSVAVNSETNGVVERVNFNTVNGNVSVTTPDTTRNNAGNYTTRVTGVTTGADTVSATAVMDTGRVCTAAPAVAVDVDVPGCGTPGDLNVGNDSCVGNTRTIPLSWDAVPGVTSYQVQLREVGGTAQSKTVTGTSTSFTGLAPGEYEARVRVASAPSSVCDDTQAGWTGWEDIEGTVQVRLRMIEDNENSCGGNSLASGISGWGYAFSNGGPNDDSISGATETVRVDKCSTHVVTVDLDDTQEWLFNACNGSGDAHRAQKSTGLLDGATSNLDYYVTDVAASWFQVVGGDLMAAGGSVEVELPPGSNEYLSRDLGTAEESAGLVVGKGGVTVKNGASRVREGKNWAVQGRYDDDRRRENYDYFRRLFGLPLSGASDDFAGNANNVNLRSRLNSGQGQNTIGNDLNDSVYYQGSNMTVTTGVNVGAGEEMLVFVEGDVRIEDDIAVADGGFFALIVDGTIEVARGVSTLQGMYVANEELSILGTDDNLADQDIGFVGEGTFVAWGGVILERDLGIDNDQGPGEQFVYRPDLVVNAPEEFYTVDRYYQEVAPRDLSLPSGNSQGNNGGGNGGNAGGGSEGNSSQACTVAFGENPVLVSANSEGKVVGVAVTGPEADEVVDIKAVLSGNVIRNNVVDVYPGNSADLEIVPKANKSGEAVVTVRARAKADGGGKEVACLGKLEVKVQ